MDSAGLLRRRAACVTVGRWLIHVGASAPAVWLLGGWIGGWLGPNPLNTLLHVSGISALVLLWITLTVTPARQFSVWLSRTVALRFGRRLSDWNWLVRLRRQLGLFSFFYAALHLGLYAWLDAGLDLQAVLDDMQERPFLLIGMAAWVALLPLAITSNQASMRWLGRRWGLLHRLVYPASLLVLLHFGLQAKAGDHRVWPYAIVLAGLLMCRLIGRLRGDRGEIVAPRPATPAVAQAVSAPPQPNLTPPAHSAAPRQPADHPA